MNWTLLREKMSSPILWLGILGTLKFLAQSMGYTIPDGVLNNIANGAAGVVMVISIFIDHGKKPAITDQPTAQING